MDCDFKLNYYFMLGSNCFSFLLMFIDDIKLFLLFRGMLGELLSYVYIGLNAFAPGDTREQRYIVF